MSAAHFNSTSVCCSSYVCVWIAVSGFSTSYLPFPNQCKAFAARHSAPLCILLHWTGKTTRISRMTGSTTRYGQCAMLTSHLLPVRDPSSSFSCNRITDLPTSFLAPTPPHPSFLRRCPQRYKIRQRAICSQHLLQYKYSAYCWECPQETAESSLDIYKPRC